MYTMLRGIPLPATGTFEARLLAEGILRERNEKFAFASLITRMAGKLGVPQEDLSLWLQEYGEELYQFRYNSRYESAAKKLEAARAEQETNNFEMLNKVALMTVE